MREPERIDRICDKLKKRWKEVPDQRLGQFLINYVFRSRPIQDTIMWLQEDDKTEVRLDLM